MCEPFKRNTAAGLKKMRTDVCIMAEVSETCLSWTEKGSSEDIT
jgi:hypothetical protein